MVTSMRMARFMTRKVVMRTVIVIMKAKKK